MPVTKRRPKTYYPRICGSGYPVSRMSPGQATPGDGISSCRRFWPQGWQAGRFFGGHPRLAGYLFGNPSVHRPHTRQARPLQPPIPLYFPSPSANRLKGNRLPCPNPEHLKENSGWFVEAYFSPDILFASNRQDFSYSLTVIPIPFFPPDFPDLVNSMLNIEFYGNHQKHPK